MNASQVSPKEYLAFYAKYLDKAGSVDLIPGLQNGFKLTLSFFESISEAKFEYKYAEGKWTIKELIQHIIDTERVFTYRALHFAREDANVLEGFDENDYAVSSMANNRSKESLIDEYKALKRSTILLFSSFTNDMLMRIGVASGGYMSVRAIAFVIIGHEAHHCEVIKERYL